MGATLSRVELRSPFLLRTAQPPIEEAHGRRVTDVRRMGKRIVVALEGERFLVLHLMIAGRLLWLPAAGKGPPARITLAVLHFSSGRLAFTEAGSKRRASLHYVAGARRAGVLRSRRPRRARVGPRPPSRSGCARRTTRSSARSPIRGS